MAADHDSRVLAGRGVRCRAWELGSLLDWVLARAHAAGFPSATVACEPTGHRWRVLDQFARGRGIAAYNMSVRSSPCGYGVGSRGVA